MIDNECTANTPPPQEINSSSTNANRAEDGTCQDSNSSPTESEIAIDDIPKMAMKVIKEHLKQRAISTSGQRKQILVDRLTEAIHNKVPLAENQSNEVAQNLAGAGVNPGSYWKYLNEEEHSKVVIEESQNVDGVQFRDPTVPHEYSGGQEAPKRNYIQSFDHPPFIVYTIKPKLSRRGELEEDEEGNFVYKKLLSTATNPNIEYLHLNNIDIDSHPAEWYELFLPTRIKQKDNFATKCTLEDIMAWTNTKALMMNAGKIGGMYSRFNNFTISEIKQHLGLYMANGLSPSPRIERKFSSEVEDVFNGNALCHRVFKGSKGILRHKEFKCFLAMTNPLLPPTC